ALAHAGEMPARRAATMRALSLPEYGPGSLLADAAGDPLVYIHLSHDDPRVHLSLRQAGARIIHASHKYSVVTAVVAPRQLAAVRGGASVQEALAPMVQAPVPPSEWPAMALAGPTAPPCPAGSIVSEGDTQLRAARARERFGVDGSGVTVGVLSGSYDVETAT